MSLFRLLALTITALVVIVGLGLAASYWIFIRRIAADVERLVAAAQPSATIITDAMLAPLPPAAQRYFRYAGIVGRPIPKLVRLRQEGRIRSGAGSGWMTFEADEIYSTSPPAFVWRTWLPARATPVALGRDEYLDGQGSILIKMASLVPLADEHGGELAEAGLMRYLNETMWFPAALLGPEVVIAPIDDGSFRATLTDFGATADAMFFVDPEGRLTNFRARRFNTGTGTTETWETPVMAYGQFNGLNLPSAGAAVWKLATGDFTYIELGVTDIAYE
ncbi:MAG TPA: DUF6544 family protein [Devosia sp.]|nr:DUF6544 family protein [Devosia sp.]